MIYEQNFIKVFQLFLWVKNPIKLLSRLLRKDHDIRRRKRTIGENISSTSKCIYSHICICIFLNIKCHFLTNRHLNFLSSNLVRNIWNVSRNIMKILLSQMLCKNSQEFYSPQCQSSLTCLCEATCPPRSPGNWTRPPRTRDPVIIIIIMIKWHKDSPSHAHESIQLYHNTWFWNPFFNSSWLQYYLAPGANPAALFTLAHFL